MWVATGPLIFSEAKERLWIPENEDCREELILSFERPVRYTDRKPTTEVSGYPTANERRQGVRRGRDTVRNLQVERHEKRIGVAADLNANGLVALSLLR